MQRGRGGVDTGGREEAGEGVARGGREGRGAREAGEAAVGGGREEAGERAATEVGEGQSVEAGEWAARGGDGHTWLLDAEPPERNEELEPPCRRRQPP